MLNVFLGRPYRNLRSSWTWIEHHTNKGQNFPVNDGEVELSKRRASSSDLEEPISYVLRS